ncbi:MAG: hypothetical protein HRU38_09675 [Saccharospirillaceae bacterium]|nr:hypothetical protein [Pseudomonadales bacterium]NRB78921.1 hypothetical protein [Saccharospirillaceae bacterium]
MTLQLTLQSNFKFEFAFGKIAQGKEMQLFGEYFPAIAPLIAEYGNQQVGTFAIIASNIKGSAPEMGAFTHWVSEEKYKAFYSDPRFIKVKTLRDDSLDLFSEGHFFNSSDHSFEVSTELDYAVVISKAELIGLTPMFNLQLENDSPKQTYIGQSITLSLWDDHADKLLAASLADTEVFRIRFNAPTS